MVTRFPHNRRSIEGKTKRVYKVFLLEKTHYQTSLHLMQRKVCCICLYLIATDPNFSYKFSIPVPLYLLEVLDTIFTRILHLVNLV